MVTAIVSTAAPGAESGALDAAIDLGIGYGGRTWRVELPPIYASRMRGVDDRGMAVRLNVQDSDGTLIVSFSEKLEGRTKHAGDQCKQQRKPARHLILPAGGRTRIPDVVRSALLQWIDSCHISVLHVVGPGEEHEPGIAEATRLVLVWILEDDVGSGGVVGVGEEGPGGCDGNLPPGPAAGDFARAPLGPFAGADRSAAPESLQHVADPLSLTDPLSLAVERIRRSGTQRPAVSPELHAELSSAADAIGGLTTEARGELEQSIRQAEGEIRESPSWPGDDRVRARPDLGIDCMEMRIGLPGDYFGDLIVIESDPADPEGR